MIALQILDIKDFMAKLLTQTTFDHFLLSEATITTYNTFHIDGHLNMDFFDDEEAKSLKAAGTQWAPWSRLRPFCLALIKGRRTPLNFKYIFWLAPQHLAALAEKITLPFPVSDINGLMFHIKYDGSSLSCTTGTSIKLFTMDKSLEYAWDDMIRQFFKTREIAFVESV